MFWNDTYLCCRIALVQGCLHLERNGEIMQTKMQKMKVWERHKLQVAACQKKHLKHAVLQKTKKEMEKHAKKCKSDQGPTGQTWVRKKYTKAPKKKAKPKKCKSDQTNMILEKQMQKPRFKIKMQEKCELHFCDCILRAFFCIVFLHSLFFLYFWFGACFFVIFSYFFKIAVF